MTARNVGDHVEINEQDARSGQTGFHVRYILFTSILLAIAAFGIVALLN